MSKKSWVEILFTWLYRIFSYLAPAGYVLWTTLIKTLINDEVTVWDKVGCGGIFALIVIVLLAVFFFGRFLKKRITNLTNQCIECVDNDKKLELVAKKRKWESRQELFRNLCFVAPFIISWLLVTLIEKEVISLRGTLLIVSVSLCAGFGFNAIAQWLKNRNKNKE